MTGQNQTPTSNTAGTIDIAEVLQGIWKRKLWIVLTTLIALVGSIVFVMKATPIYQTEAKVLVDNQETRFTNPNAQRGIITPVDQQEVKSQLEVLHSRDLAKRVIKDLNLTSLREFDPLKKGIGPVSRFLISVGFKTDPRKQTPEQRAISVYYQKINAYQIPDSKVIAISVKSVSPKIAADVANKLAEEFVSSTRETQLKSTGRARNWLAEQIALLRKKVIQSEVAVEKFRAKAGLLKGRDQNSTLSNQELSELNSQIILAEAQRAQIQARAKALRDQLAKTGNVASSSEVLNSPLIQRLRERQITLKGRIAELSTTYLPNHPRIKAVYREMAGLNRQIRSEVLKIVSGLEQQAKVAATREASLRASLNGLKTRASGSNIDQVKLRALEREAKANRTLLETFLTKYSDASAREEKMAQPGLARVISRADIASEPSFPKPGPTVVLATIGGFVLSMGIAFMAAVMSSVAGTAPTAAPALKAGQAAASVQQQARQQVNQQAYAQQTAQPVQTPQPQIQTAQSPQPTGMPPAFAQVDPNVSPAYVPPNMSPNAPQSYMANNGAAQQPAQVVTNSQTTPNVSAGVSSLSRLPSSTSLQAAAMNAQSVLQNVNSPYAAGLTPIASWVLSVRQTLGAKRLAMTGLTGSELDVAASTLALARKLSSQGLRVIIIDASMQGAQFAALTDTANLPGLADLITGHASFMEVIVKDEMSDVRILRVGQPVTVAMPLLGGDRMETILGALESDDNHDIVIIHGGVISPQGQLENGAIAKSHATLLLSGNAQAHAVAATMTKLSNAGMRSTQFVRIVGDDGAQRTPENVTHMGAGAMAASMAQNQPAPNQQATAMNTPLFAKVAV